ncbi:NAD(P)/FAD-dependent oxidoreductase [Rubrobacter aplysinae]|uniref:NAD(P)/FAD-dependent oxidoreductase n=1 Tax=Rubrobacter aplysinae TaxID=909625 RepID=UPI00064C17BE|nr:FAD-dependent oxidoreductase [Rubrobacter aplysinae]
MAPGPRKPTIAFAGGGHANLYSLRRAGELAGRGFDVVLVNPSPYLYYSGMATGVVSGLYAEEQARIDVRRLAEGGGGRFVEGRVERVLPGELLLEGGGRVSFDAASFNLGSETPDDGGDAGDGEAVIPVKPVANAARIRDRVLTLMQSGDAPRVLVAGGGAAGCEVAANLLALTEVTKVAEGRVRLTLAEAGEGLLPDSPARAGRVMRDSLEGRGAEVLLESPVRRMGEGVARAGKLEIPYDLFVSAVGLAPTGAFLRSARFGADLLTGADGGLWVNRYLQSVSQPALFGGGDSVAFRGGTLPTLGVFAVRQAPVIFHNLQAFLRGEPLRAYEPQRHYLYVLNLGDGTGLAVYGPLVYRGRAALALKHRIDSRFVELEEV